MSGQYHYRAFVNMLPSFANLTGYRSAMRGRGRAARASARAALAHARTFRRRRIVHLRRRAHARRQRFEPGDSGGESRRAGGPSGAGKSTIADILMGLVLPDSGTLKLDGRPLGPEGVRGWRDQIGYVAPDTFLFHDTIRANLKWARPDASEDEMLAALRQASAFDFVAGLKDGLDTVVGDRGMMVSQGERQRLALARAFLRRPSMLILDEATNSLDSENEGRVLDAIESRRGELTVVLIAHRLSTIRRADLIYVVEGGKVVESGDWSSLSAKRDGRLPRPLGSAEPDHLAPGSC